ncbi:hypothetical protein ACHAWO_006713 [Cyclotella atomus]|uniref:EF-hand domain-containing protein n=1 Tax=Cyclotella atomus TaxID=382360 RepID=A0ABD3PCZ2_9STRA
MIAARVQAAAVAPSVEPSSPNNNAAEIQPSDSSGVEPSVSFFDKVKVLVTLQILSRKWFQMLILLNIIITSILAGIETYGSHGRAVQTADTVILVIFGFEVALRIFAECPQPWKYFIGKDWLSNWFDFAVVAMGIFASGISNDTFSVSLLPVLRLMRLTKLVSKISAMKKILSGLAGGIKSAIYIIALIFLVLYIYAIIAMNTFKENNPWHYRSLPISILSLFRAATLVDWAKIAYIDILGCDKSSDSVYAKSNSVEGLDPFWYCTSPSTSYIVGPFFWSSFIVVSSLVMLSLFIGSITVAMSDSMNKLRDDERRENKHHRLMEKLASQSNIDRTSMDETISGRRRSSISARVTLFLGLELSNLEKYRAKKKLGRLLGRAFRNGDARDDEEEDTTSDQTSWKSPLMGKYVSLSTACRHVTLSKLFHQLSTGVILFAGLLVGIQTDDKFVDDYQVTLSVLDALILIAFTAEVLIKVLAEGLYPCRYFFTISKATIHFAWWNVFDFVIVLGNYLLLFDSNTSILSTLRLVRILRVLRLVRSFPELQIIIEALITGLKSIGYIGGLLLIVIYIFGILGTMLFGQNDPFHFGSLHMSILTLFRISTLEGWSDIMYINMYGCDLFGYDAMEEECTFPNPTGLAATLFFVTFVIVSSLGLLTLFVSVITTSMDEAKQKQALAKVCEDKIQQMCLSERALRNYKAAFTILDLDNSGSISQDELLIGLQSVGFNPSLEQLRAMMAAADVDRSGQIDLFEFILIMNKHSQQEEGNTFC